MRLLACLALPIVLVLPASAQTGGDPGSGSGAGVGAEDRLIHEQMLVLDTHLDIPERFDSGQWDFSEPHLFAWDGSQVDLPRMRQGGLDGGFFVIYTTQGPLTEEG